MVGRYGGHNYVVGKYGGHNYMVGRQVDLQPWFIHKMAFTSQVSQMIVYSIAKHNYVDYKF